MKIRKGFVSNSSSSSFVIINYSPIEDEKFDLVNYELNSESNFGWGPEKISDMPSKINWAILQANENSEDYEKIKNVCKKYKIEITDEYIEEVKEKSWLDHQSHNDENHAVLFLTDEDLEQFLFHYKSHIQLDNDNY